MDRRPQQKTKGTSHLACVAACAALSLSCGYHFVTQGPADLPSGLGVVAVRSFDNRTPELGLGLDCARLLQGEFGASARLTDQPDEADVVIDGSVDSISERPVAFSRAAPRQVEMEISLHGELRARQRQGDLGPLTFEGAATYEAAGAATAMDADRTGALRLACRRAMHDAAEALARELSPPLPAS